jgi:eukaryotic-like serine/threonine-protein kinase
MVAPVSRSDVLARPHDVLVAEAVRADVPHRTAESDRVPELMDERHLRVIAQRDVYDVWGTPLKAGIAALAEKGGWPAPSTGRRWSRSSSGMVIGTPAYMSSEQAMAEEDLGPACDIYALGCVVYEMLTGELPFSGATPQVIIARHLAERPRSIRSVRPELPGNVEHAVLTALAKGPAERPGSAGALVRLLQGSGR